MNKKEFKSIDSLVTMLQIEENRAVKDEKIIQILKDKIQERILHNNNILYGISGKEI